MPSRCLFHLSLICLCLLSPAACRKSPPSAAKEPPIVGVTTPVQRQVIDFVDLTGRTAAPQSVEIRARVTGYLVATPFKEGAEVKTGDTLFQIDPRPYQSQLDNAQASVGVAEARLRLAAADNQRAKLVRKNNASAISEQDLDKYQASEDEAAASLNAAKAALENAKLNLLFTSVSSPINGRVSRYGVTVGNLVNQANTLLTSVVSEDPMQVYFDLDEPTLLRIARYLREKTESLSPLAERKVPALLGLSDEKDYPHSGYLDFAENQVDSSTGTISVRAVFDNPASPSGVRLLKPGMFVRIRLPLGQPYQALLVPDSCLGSDQGSKYLLTVDADNIVQYQAVTSGPLQADGLRVISQGLKGGEKVICSGLQAARPKMKVQIEEPTKSSGANS